MTENAADFVALLEQRAASDEPLVPVLVVLKRNLPRGGCALSTAVADRLVRWSDANADPQ